MKPKQVIEILKNLTCVVPKDKAEETKQAIDHAINCVGAIEQIKWERDIAISQLNELGYQFGEKVEKQKTWTEILKNKGYLFEDETIPQALIKLAKALAILVGGAVFIGTVIGLILR